MLHVGLPDYFQHVIKLADNAARLATSSIPLLLPLFAPFPVAAHKVIPSSTPRQSWSSSNCPIKQWRQRVNNNGEIPLICPRWYKHSAAAKRFW